MKKMDVIYPAHTEWVAPTSVARKKHLTLRFLRYDRKLRAVSAGDAYPIPRMYEYIDCLGDTTVFSKLDANCRYWHI